MRLRDAPRAVMRTAFNPFRWRGRLGGCIRIAGVLSLFVLLALAASPVGAEEPVQAALQAVQGERRSAILALQQGDRERAQAVVRRLAIRWSGEIAVVPIVRRVSEPGLDEAIRRFEAGIATAAALIELSDADGAIERLVLLTSMFDDWRQRRRLPLFADCVDEFARDWERLELARERAHHLIAAELAERAARARSVLARCAAISQANMRDAEFVALSARLYGSLGRLEQALLRGDTAAADRLIGEQRGLERAIAYRSD